MKAKHRIQTIDLFNRAICSGQKVDYCEITIEAAKRGYLVHPDCATKEVLDYLRKKTINPNATFYKEWNDVISKNRIELFIDQILHYTSTYGTDFEDEPYIPNDGDIKEPDMKVMKVIMPISETEVYDKCIDMLESGVAMSSITVDYCVNVVCDFAKEFKLNIEIDNIKNREAQAKICHQTGLFPSKAIDMLRYLVYQATGDSMIVQNKELYRRIVESISTVDMRKLNDEQLKELSTIFLRYKMVFLAFKTNQHAHAKAVVNKIGRYAKLYHRPLKQSFWNEVLSKPMFLEDVEKHLDELSNYKLVTILQAINERQMEGDAKVYVIRNSKVFISHTNGIDKYVNEYYDGLYELLYDELVKRLSAKKCVVRYPKGLNIAIPTTEKTFMGNVPFGSYYDIAGKNNYIGIYWKEEWGTRDFDLHLYDNTGNHYGWNASYGDGRDIVFSGDMTSADPEAAEVVLLRRPDINGIVKVNRFNGQEGSKFILYFGQEKKCNITSGRRGYIVDPNSIVQQIELTSSKAEQVVGILSEGRFILCDLKSTNRIVGPNKIEMNLALQKRTKSAIMLRPVLEQAGFLNYDAMTDEEREKVDEVLDLTVLDKNTIISLLA